MKADRNWQPTSWQADPTPEEIRRETAAIRAGWSRRERHRRTTAKPIPWMLPTVDLRELGDPLYDPDAGAVG